MPTFKSKPVEPEIVDARQFTGGGDSARDIINWVRAKDDEYTHADYRLNVGGPGINSVIDCVELWNSHRGHYITVYTDFWVVHHQNGKWSVMHAGALKDKYDEV